jgi:dipeptidyl aminopeptidase/acylaminoacyl peptidase
VIGQRIINPKKWIRSSGLGVAGWLVVLALAGAACGGKLTPGPLVTPGKPSASPPPTVQPGTQPALTATLETQAVTALPPPEAGNLRVVYVKAGDLWMWHAGQAVQLASGMNPGASSGGIYAPRFSPDGMQIAFLRKADDFHLELWVIGADGAGERRLVSVADLDTIGAAVRSAGALAINPYHYAWIPGRNQILFNSQQVYRGLNPIPVDDLNLVDVETGKLTFSLLAGWGGEFVVSPDGSRVAVSTPTQISLVDPDGGNYLGVFSYDVVNTYSEYRFYAQPVWVLDSSALWAAIPPVDPLVEPRQPTEMWRIPADGSPPQLASSLEAVPFFDAPVAFAPDLSLLAYLKDLGQPVENRRELHLAGPDGSGDVVYQSGRMLQFFGWASAGRYFFFSIDENQAMVAGSPDSPAQPLNSQPFGILDPRWVDDSRYVYIQQDGDNFILCLGALGATPLILDSLSEFPLYDLNLTHP